MEAAELRPVSLGELLDRTFTLYRSHFQLFVGIMVIPSAFAVPFNVAFALQETATLGGRLSSALALLLGAASWIVYCLAIGATTYAVSEIYLGHHPTVRGSYGKMRNRLWGIIGVVLIYALQLFGIMIIPWFTLIYVVPFFVFAYFGLMALFVRWSLGYAVSIPALLLENLSMFAAIRRGVQLTRGRKWQLFVAISLSIVIGFAGVIGPFWIAMMLSARGGPRPWWLISASAALGAVGGAITWPLLMIVLVLCYYDARIRKEAVNL